MTRSKCLGAEVAVGPKRLNTDQFIYCFTSTVNRSVI